MAPNINLMIEWISTNNIYYYTSANMFIAVLFLKEKLRPEDLFGKYNGMNILNILNYY